MERITTECHWCKEYKFIQEWSSAHEEGFDGLLHGLARSCRAPLLAAVVFYVALHFSEFY